MKDTDNLLSFTKFKERFDVKTKFFTVCGIVLKIVNECHRKPKQKINKFHHSCRKLKKFLNLDWHMKS